MNFMKGEIQIITIILLGLLLSCCASTSDIATNSTQTPSPKTNTTLNVSPPTGNLPEGVSQKEAEIWNQIYKSNVEKTCLNTAKKEAGTNSWAVRSCTCIANEQGFEKQYSCNLDILDPSGTKYFININCKLLNHTCIVDSNKGQQIMTIEDLDKLRQQ